MVLGLPGRGQLGAHATPDAAALVRRQRRVEPVEQQARDALLLAQDRAARRLVRVRGEDRLDAQALQQRQHLLERQAGLLELVDGVFHAARLGLGAVAEEILAAPADAVHLLGDVDRLEPHRERALEVARHGRGTTLDARRELGAGGLVAVAAADREGPVVLDEVEQRLAALLAQHLADQPAEQVHVLAQRGVLGRELDVVAVHGGPQTESAGTGPALPKSTRVSAAHQNL